MTVPFQSQGIRVFFGFNSPLAAGDTSGLEIQASASRNGVLVFRYEMNDTENVGVRQSAAGILDATLVVVTPTIKSNPSATLGSVIRTGQEAAGLVLIPPDFLFESTAGGNHIDRGQEFYVPPGQFLTFMRLTAAAALIGSIGMIEL